MKTLLYIAILLFASAGFAFGQSPDNSGNRKKVSSNAPLLDTIQTGTATIKNDKLVIKLTEKAINALLDKETNVPHNYFVTFTPHGNSGILKVSETNAKSFTVSPIGDANAPVKFDYVVHISYALSPFVHTEGESKK